MPVDRREVTIGAHRADVVLPDGTVCEVQYSPLRRVEIEARQETYGAGMLWIFDARKVDDRGRRHAGRALRYRIDGQRQVVDWSWRQRRYALDACAASRVYLDRSDGWLLWVRDRDEDGLLGRRKFVPRAFVVGRLNGTEDPPTRPVPPRPAPPVFEPLRPALPVQPRAERVARAAWSAPAPPPRPVCTLTPEQLARREQAWARFYAHVAEAEELLQRGGLEYRDAAGNPVPNPHRAAANARSHTRHPVRKIPPGRGSLPEAPQTLSGRLGAPALPWPSPEAGPVQSQLCAA